MIDRLKALGYVLPLVLAPAMLEAQQTRAEEIQIAREEKKAAAEPEKLSKTEARLNVIKEKRVLERFTQGLEGFTVVLGGLATGQGFALGPQLSRGDLAGGKVKLRTSARFASTGAYLIDFALGAPELANGRAFADFLATHENYPQIDYFGPGPDSSLDNETDFRREMTRIDGLVGVRPVSHMRLGVGVGTVLANTGPGPDEDRSPDQVFALGMVPGVDRQNNFLTSTLLADYDWRDNPGGPRRGGLYSAKFTYFNDNDLGLHNFRRLNLEAQQYIPFYNRRRVIALRAATTMSFENGTSTVPFYLQPVIGGSEDLRGFRQYRFYDNNSVIVNAEYRWESFTGLDLALFLDAGKVAPKASQINFHDLEASVGFGMRFNVRNSTFIRIDFGVSHEGFQYWFKFGNPF